MGTRSFWLLGLALTAATLAVPANAQVRVIVDGQVQDVPAGITRTISYAPNGRQTVRDEPFAGQAAPDCATVTTTETTDEDGDGNVIQTTVVTRIEPLVAVAWSQPATYAPAYAPLPPQPVAYQSAPHLDVDADALDAQGSDGDGGQVLKVHRDPTTGHFVTTIRINGVAVRAIVDTGAQGTILSARDAHATGADREITRSEPMTGIGGYTQLAITHVHSMDVGGQQLGGFTAAIGAEGIPYTLLGQTEIARLGRIVIENGVTTITPRHLQLAAR
jgi:clan AA aspartic protease (TIGR02281 family)